MIQHLFTRGVLNQPRGSLLRAGFFTLRPTPRNPSPAVGQRTCNLVAVGHQTHRTTRLHLLTHCSLLLPAVAFVVRDAIFPVFHRGLVSGTVNQW